MYHVDERDIQFNMFEYLDLPLVTQYPPYTDQSPDQYKMILEQALKFAQKEVDPLSAPGDREGCRLEKGQVYTPKGYKEAYQLLAQNGFLGLDVHTELGGLGLPTSLLIATFEFIIGANVAFAMYGGLTRGAAHVIDSFATKDLTQFFCPKMYDGTWAGTMCLTEPQAGSSVGDLKTTATPIEGNRFSIKGNKIFISGGDHDLTQNIIHLVLARIKGDAPGTKGLSLFIVPKFKINPDQTIGASNDVNVVNIEHKMGIKAQATASLNFGEKDQCEGFLVGDRSAGMKYMFSLMNEARLSTGMQGCALAACAFEHARRYATERIQGNNTAIINYPDVRRNLALSKAWVEGMRGLLLKTAVASDLARVTKDAVLQEKLSDMVELGIPVCKAYCTDHGFKVTELCMQVYGGYGYCNEYPIEQYMRDAKIGSIYEGTNGIQAMDLLGRKLPRNNGRAFKNFYDETIALCITHKNNESLGTAAELIHKASDKAAQVVFKIMEWNMGAEQNKVLLSATPFLELCGHLMVAKVLFEQAIFADQKIKAGSTDIFYKDKILTATFFATNILPMAYACARAILNGDESAMRVTL